jgi:hypothetical protein
MLLLCPLASPLRDARADEDDEDEKEDTNESPLEMRPLIRHILKRTDGSGRKKFFKWLFRLVRTSLSVVFFFLDFHFLEKTLVVSFFFSFLLQQYASDYQVEAW